MIVLKIIFYGIVIQSYFVFVLYPYIEFIGKNYRIINNEVVFTGLKEIQFRIKLTVLIFSLLIVAAFTENYFVIPIILFTSSYIFYSKLMKINEELNYRIGKKFNLIKFFPYLGGTKDAKSVLEYYQKKQYIKAIVLCDYYIQRRRNRFDSTIISFFEMRAQSLDASGYPLDAIEDYKSVLEIQPNGNNYGLLAMCYYKIGNWEDCMINLEQASLYKSKVFSPMYVTFKELSEVVIEEIKLRGSKSENLKRRYNWDWLEVDENLIGLEENNLKYAERQIKKYLEFDPDNENLKKLLSYCNCKGLWYDSGYTITESEIVNDKK